MSGITAQQKALYCIALAIKKGNLRHNNEAARLAQALSEEDLKKLCDTPLCSEQDQGQKPETHARRH